MLWRVKRVSGRNTRTPPPHTHTQPCKHSHAACQQPQLAGGFPAKGSPKSAVFLAPSCLNLLLCAGWGHGEGSVLGRLAACKGGLPALRVQGEEAPGWTQEGERSGTGQGDDLSVSEARKASGCGSGAFSARPDRMLSLRLGFRFWILSAASRESTSNSSSFDSLRAAQLPTRRGKISILEGAGCWGFRGGAVLGACTALAGNAA